MHSCQINNIIRNFVSRKKHKNKNSMTNKKTHKFFSAAIDAELPIISRIYYSSFWFRLYLLRKITGNVVNEYLTNSHRNLNAIIQVITIIRTQYIVECARRSYCVTQLCMMPAEKYVINTKNSCLMHYRVNILPLDVRYEPFNWSTFMDKQYKSVFLIFTR